MPANSSISSHTARIVPLSGHSASTVQLVEALRRDIERLSVAVFQLDARLATEPRGEAQVPAVSPDLADEVLSLQRAAHAIGWAVPRLRRHIVRHNRKFPRDPLGYQPGGMSKTEWSIPMARLRQYVRGQRP